MTCQDVTKEDFDVCGEKKLWLEILEPETAVVKKIVSLGKSMGLDVDEG